MLAITEIIYLKKVFVQGRTKRKKNFIINTIPTHFDFYVYTKGFSDKQQFFVNITNKLVLNKIEGIKSNTKIIAVINIKNFWVEILDIITDTATAEELKNIFEKYKTVRKINRLF